MNRRALMLRTLVLACMASLAYARDPAGDVIRIGLTGPFSGASAPMGESMRAGARIAVEEMNRFLGGVRGKRIELVERDDAADPKRGAEIAEELTRGQVVATVGIVNTGVGLTSIDTYQHARVPLVIAVSTGSALTRKFAPPAAAENYVFRVSPRTDIETAFLIRHVVERARFVRIAILADDTPYGESGKGDLEKALAARGLAPVAVERFKLGTTDMGEALRAARAAGADAVVMYGIGPELAAIARSRAAMKWSVPLYAGWTASMQSFIEAAGRDAEGVMMPLTFVQDGEHPRRRSFVAAYAEQHGTGPMPSPMAAAQAYDAMRILLNALQSAAGEKGPQVREALENITSRVEGVITIYSRPFTREDHDAITQNILVMGVVRKGKADYAFREDANRSFVTERKRAGS